MNVSPIECTTYSPLTVVFTLKSVRSPQFYLLVETRLTLFRPGQAIGANAALLPRPVQLKFSKLFDDAPQIPYSIIHSVFLSEFGRSPSGPGGVFEVFEEKAVASASIAQVHKAKLWSMEGEEERWVAVKVQKPDVGKQMEWDLGAYRIVMWMFEHWAFDLPVYFVVGALYSDNVYEFSGNNFQIDFVSDHLRRELDFAQEAANAKQTAEFIATEPRLADSVYIPKVYPELSTKKVMTAEWIDGVRLSDRPAILRLLGEREHNYPPLPSSPFPASPSESSSTLRPQLKGGVKYIMQTMVELFSAQIFSWGWVHCDPHPGNIIIRPHPTIPDVPQLVLLDHGLYVRLTEDFRKQYATLWKGLLATNFRAVEGVTKEWGIGAPDLFASATLMRPMELKGGEEDKQKTGVAEKELTQYEQSVRMKERLKGFLTDTDRIPKELIFLGRNMR